MKRKIRNLKGKKLWQNRFGLSKNWYGCKFCVNSTFRSLSFIASFFWPILIILLTRDSLHRKVYCVVTFMRMEKMLTKFCELNFYKHG